MSALTGVGPDMASGSHVERGSCADFPTAPPSRRSARSVASPNRETEAMKDGSDAVADWPILNALINAVNGASWVSVHHGGGVGMGFSLHAGQVIVADGTDDAARRLERVLSTTRQQLGDDRTQPVRRDVEHRSLGVPARVEGRVAGLQHRHPTITRRLHLGQ